MVSPHQIKFLTILGNSKEGHGQLRHWMKHTMATVLMVMLLAACGGGGNEPPAVGGETAPPQAAEEAVAAPEAEEVAGGTTSSHEAPMLAELVAAGELPPLEERLPQNPMVIEPVETIGQYGGTWRHPVVGSFAARLYSMMGNENLVIWTPDWSGIVPNVAESYEASEDASEFTFHLREGMKWSDGHPFTADDIMFWYEDVFLNDELSPSKPSWLVINDEPVVVEKIDDFTVRFKFSGPYGLFLQQLATPSGTAITTYPRHYMEQFHIKYNPEGIEQLMAEAGVDTWIDLFQSKVDPTGSGATWMNKDLPVLYAWRPVTSQQEATTRIITERNPYFWKVDTAGNQLPYVDRIVWEFVQDPEVLLLRTLNGEVEFMNYYANTLTNKAVLFDNMEAGDYSFFDQISDSSNTVVITLNMNHSDPVKREIFQNKDFRIGLSHAINRQEIIDVVYVGQGEPYQGAPRPESNFYHERLARQYTEYDVDLANEYLDRAGYSQRNEEGIRLGPDGQPISFGVSVDDTRFPDWVDVLELVKKYWAAVGIDMQVQAMDGTLLQARRDANDFDATANFSDGGLAVMLSPKLYFPDGGGATYALAWASWYNPGTAGGAIEPEEPPEPVKRQMALYDQLKATADEQKQIELMNELLDIAADQFYVIGISLQPRKYGVVKNNFRNVPKEMPEAWLYPDPFPTHPYQYFIAQD